MYYYLLYNSSFSFIVENRLFSTLLYGSILYILTHAILNYCDVSILSIINNYFWITLTLDIISFTYAISNSFLNNDSVYSSDDGSVDSNSNSLNVSFNLLKNKINTMLDRKNDLTITHIPNTHIPNTNIPNTNIPNQLQEHTKTNNNNPQKNNKVQIQENFNNVTTYNNNNNNTNSSTNTIDDFDFTDLDDVIQPPSSQPLAQFSTPLKHLQVNKNNMNNINTNTNTNTNTSTTFKSSTPISLIRSNTKISEPTIQDDNGFGNGFGNGNGNESIAGSDVGSIMDLEDFENSF
jgi:hypothetical protein